MKSRPIVPIGVPILVILLISGCGGRTFTGIPDSGAQNNTNNGNNSNTNGNGNGNGNNNINPGECLTSDDCVVAAKWDVCCSCPVPASAQDLAQDPCLIPVEQSAVPEQCYIDCPAIPCPHCEEWGKSVTCDVGSCEWFEGRCTQDVECVAAVRVDNCCQPAMPANRADIEADPCLVPWPGWWEDIPQFCYDQWDPVCDLIDCAPSPPLSRAMGCEQNWCVYETECESPSDCTLFVDTRQCCGCPEPWPVSMAGHDPCIVPWGTPPPDGCMPEACLGVLCEQCPDRPTLVCDNENVCTGDWNYYP